MSNDPIGRTSITGIISGFSGMLMYYLMIGVLLAIGAVCCGGPLLIGRLLAGDATSDTQYEAPGVQNDDDPYVRPVSTNLPDDRTPEWMRSYVGDYSRHGQSLQITADGQGVYRSRSYVTCGSESDTGQGGPCEQVPGEMPMRVEFTLVQSGDAVLAQIGSTNTSGFAGDMPVTMTKPGIVGFDNLEFCNASVVIPEEDREVCGA